MNFEEAMSWVSQTNYEKEHNISILKKEIILDTDDIKLVKVEKSTGEFGLCIIYKSSVRKDTWVVWYPSKNQTTQLKIISKTLNEVDKNNKNFWVKNGNKN